MNIAIIGGGNIGTLLAAQLSAGNRGGVNHIRVYSSKPLEWNPEIEIWDKGENILCTVPGPELCSANLEAVLSGAQIIFVTVPSFLFRETAAAIEPYICPGMEICIVPGNGGAEVYFNGIREKGGVLCAFERVHATAKLKEYGKAVRQLSLKKSIRVAIMQNRYLSAWEFAKQIEELLPVSCEPLPNMLCVSLAPSNPILHTPRLYRLFCDYDGSGYQQEKYMFDTWDDETSEILFACDEELQRICECLDRLDLDPIPSLKDYYESYTVREFTAKMRNIPAFCGSKAPMVLRSDGWHPDFNSRLFLADIEYGLQFMMEVGRCAQVDTSTMNMILRWYEKVTQKKACTILPYDTKNQLYEWYLNTKS